MVLWVLVKYNRYTDSPPRIMMFFLGIFCHVFLIPLELRKFEELRLRPGHKMLTLHIQTANILQEKPENPSDVSCGVKLPPVLRPSKSEGKRCSSIPHQ